MTFAKLKELYQQVDLSASKLEERHQQRLMCKRGCSQCCVDELTVFAIEADHIRLHSSEILEQEPRAAGMCAFLDKEGACRIYDSRPYVCRTQGLPLRWLEEDDFETIEYRDICPLNDEGEPLEDLPEEAFWTLGEAEGQLAELQHEHGRGKMTRVPLRNLFNK